MSAIDPYAQPSREWWAQRWIDVLESFGWVRRLERARIYAREGNVLTLEFKGSKVQALVQGTAPEPYKVTLSLDPFTDQQWGYVLESMAQQALFSAKLLAGEMPPSIEKVFTGNGLSLFPLTKFDIHSRCSCPDPATPCKHIGAVYYILGDRFSEDPFVLFQLRGRSKDQLLEALRQMRSQNGEPVNQGAIESSPNPAPPPAPPLPPLDQLWTYEHQLESSLVVITPSPSSETVLDVLGPIPYRSPATPNTPDQQAIVRATMEHLQAVYQTVAQQAIVQGMTVESDRT